MLGFGNYAGDRLNFGVAAERLINEGIDTRIVYVTDDVASASPEEQKNGAGSQAPLRSTRSLRLQGTARTSMKSSA